MMGTPLAEGCLGFFFSISVKMDLRETHQQRGPLTIKCVRELIADGRMMREPS